MRRCPRLGPWLITAALIATAACSGADAADPVSSPTATPPPAPTAATPATATTPPVSGTEGEPAAEPAVTLRRSSITWETYAYELTPFNTIRMGSYDGETRTERTFDTWVLENEYLEVTLLPEFGGRILSIVYKPTGHEQLYQNPLGVPYQIDTGVFFWDWMMVYGGIFPTFPEPEHGKTWFLPWQFAVVTERDDAVTVAMSFVDDLDHPLAPRRYRGAATGLEVTFLVTLEAGRAAVDTEVVIENPGDGTVSFEYWTSATLAPGSEPGNTRATGQTEIVAAVDRIMIPSFWSAVAAEEEPAGLPDVYVFDRLRRFENWPDMGIAYAFPDMGRGNFWGVIDHASGEGIFRIADPEATPGMKIWTWGYPQTADTGGRFEPAEARPYIELWAGVTRRFFERTEIGGHTSLRISETYAPSVGLTGVTHAAPDVLAYLSADHGGFRAELFGLRPGSPVAATLTLDDEVIHAAEVIFDPVGATVVVAPVPATDGVLRLVLADGDGAPLFTGTLDVAGG